MQPTRLAMLPPSAAMVSKVASAAVNKNPLLRNCIAAILVNKAPNTTSRRAYEGLVRQAIEGDNESISYTKACENSKYYTQPPLKKKKGRGGGAGHIGTLDPFATGALPVFFGLGTKFVSLFNDLSYDKNYEATLKLGVKTESGDLDGAVVRTDENYKEVTNDAVVESAKSLVGQLVQKANIYSAQKVDGRPLYWYAQNNETPPWLPEKTVTITECEAQLEDPQTISIKVQCGSGTYVRTLGEQLADKVGTCGHLTALHRSRRGPFKVDETLPVGSESVIVTQYTIGELLDMLNVTTIKCEPQNFRRRLDEQLRWTQSHLVKRLLRSVEPGLYCLQIGEHPVVVYQKFEDKKQLSLKIIASFPVPPSGFIFPTSEHLLNKKISEDERTRRDNSTTGPSSSSMYETRRR